MDIKSTIPKIGNRKKKSVKLNPVEHKTLKSLRKKFHTDTDFSEFMEIDRNTMLRVLAFGSGSEDTIIKVREKLTSL